MAATLLREATMAGLRVEVGEATLSSNTVEVPTHLTKIHVALATYTEAPGADERLYCDQTITNGCVTFQDTSVAAKTFQYVLFGI